MPIDQTASAIRLRMKQYRRSRWIRDHEEDLVILGTCAALVALGLLGLWIFGDLFHEPQ